MKSSINKQSSLSSNTVFMKQTLSNQKSVFHAGKLKVQNYCGFQLNACDLTEYYVIGQFDMKFIIAKHKLNKDMVMLDQHAIHERILYECFTNAFSHHFANEMQITELTLKYHFLYSEVFKKHTLLIPICLNLCQLQTEFDYTVFKQYNSVLNFDFSVSKNILTIYSVPTVFDSTLDLCEAAEIFLNIFENYDNLFTNLPSNTETIKVQFESEMKHLKVNDIVYDIFDRQLKSKACRNAIMFNDKLDLQFMQEILKQLSKCRRPFVCAHGRINFFICHKS